MPAFDSEQGHYAVNQHAGPASTHDSAAQGTIDPSSVSTTSAAPIPPLPFYKPPARKSVSSVTTQPVSQSHTNGVVHSTPDDETSDPDQFYRSHQPPYGMGSVAGLGQGDIRVEKRGDGRGVPHHLQRPNNVSAPMNGPKLPPLASRITARHASSPTSGPPPMSATRSNPGLSSTAQKRRTSVRELANRFNEAAEEVPPVPGTSASRSGSTSLQCGKSACSIQVQKIVRNPFKKSTDRR